MTLNRGASFTLHVACLIFTCPLFLFKCASAFSGPLGTLHRYENIGENIKDTNTFGEMQSPFSSTSQNMAALFFGFKSPP